MFSLTKFFAFIILTAEAKFLYEPDGSPSVYVNNMRPEPTYLTEDVDMVEYQYVDGDVINIRCGDFYTLYDNILMEYAMEDTLRDLFNTTLPTGNFVGFVSKLHSEHNDSYVICRNEDNGVQTVVKFILQKEFAVISIDIDEMTMRQKKKVGENTYLIDYQHLSSIDNEAIKVDCEMDKEDLKLEVMDSFVNNLTDYKKTEIIRFILQKSKISFVPSDASYKLQCLARDNSGKTSETVVIRVTRYTYFTGNFPLHLELTSRGTVTELYSINKYYGLRVIIYEFDAGEVLQLNCSVPNWDNQHYLKSDSETCWEDGCTITKQFNLTQSADNTKFTCYFMERTDTINGTATNTTEHDIFVAEFRVLFSMRNSSSLTALISSNKTIFWQNYERMTGVNPGPENTDHTTTIIVSVVSVVAVLCGLGFLILWLSRRYFERKLEKQIAANMAPPFYLNLILRGDCDRRIAELDQHVYEEIGPPIYEVIDNSTLKEMDYTVPKKNSGSVCRESGPSDPEETEALAHMNVDDVVHEEIEALVHMDGDTSTHEEFDASVHQGIDTSEHKGIDEPVCKVTDRDE